MIMAVFGQQLAAARGNSTCLLTATMQQRAVCLMEDVLFNI